MVAILVSIVQPPRNGNTAPSMASSMERSATDVALRERHTTSLTDSVLPHTVVCLSEPCRLLVLVARVARAARVTKLAAGHEGRLVVAANDGGWMIR